MTSSEYEKATENGQLSYEIQLNGRTKIALVDRDWTLTIETPNEALREAIERLPPLRPHE